MKERETERQRDKKKKQLVDVVFHGLEFRCMYTEEVNRRWMCGDTAFNLPLIKATRKTLSDEGRYLIDRMSDLLLQEKTILSIQSYIQPIIIHMQEPLQRERARGRETYIESEERENKIIRHVQTQACWEIYVYIYREEDDSVYTAILLGSHLCRLSISIYLAICMYVLACAQEERDEAHVDQRQINSKDTHHN